MKSNPIAITFIGIMLITLIAGCTSTPNVTDTNEDAALNQSMTELNNLESDAAVTLPSELDSSDLDNIEESIDPNDLG